MAGEGPGHVDPREDFGPREPRALPKGHHPMGIDGVPAVHEDDRPALHDRADAQEGRQVEHEVAPAVDQGDLAALEGPEDAVEGGDRGDEGLAHTDAFGRDADRLRDEDDGLPLVSTDGTV